jgi:hypothetical protein
MAIQTDMEVPVLGLLVLERIIPIVLAIHAYRTFPETLMSSCGRLKVYSISVLGNVYLHRCMARLPDYGTHFLYMEDFCWLGRYTVDKEKCWIFFSQCIGRYRSRILKPSLTYKSFSWSLFTLADQRILWNDVTMKKYCSEVPAFI